MVINEGISFGIGIPMVELMIGLVLIGMLFWWWRQRKNKKSFGLLLIILGGVLNLISRFQHGGVIDYWKIPGVPIYNNLADWIIFVGVIWYLLR